MLTIIYSVLYKLFQQVIYVCTDVFTKLFSLKRHVHDTTKEGFKILHYSIYFPLYCFYCIIIVIYIIASFVFYNTSTKLAII